MSKLNVVVWLSTGVNEASSDLMSLFSSVSLSHSVSVWLLVMLNIASVRCELLNVVVVGWLVWEDDKSSVSAMFRRNDASVWFIEMGGVMSEAMLWNMVCELGLPFIVMSKSVVEVMAVFDAVVDCMVSEIVCTHIGSMVWSKLMMRDAHLMVWLLVEAVHGVCWLISESVVHICLPSNSFFVIGL
jgi:hypothetical protein